MRKILKSKALQLFLMIAFVSMQSASAHIHLASHHNHDDNDHAHSHIAHAHNVASHHVDAFGLAEENHSSQIVELSQDWLGKHGKSLGELEQPVCINAEFPHCDIDNVDDEYIDAVYVQPTPHFHSKIRARAPPAAFTSLI